MAAIIPSDVHCARHRNLTHTLLNSSAQLLTSHTPMHKRARTHMLMHIWTNMCTDPQMHTHTHTHHQPLFFSASTAVGCCLLPASHILSLFLSFPHTLACMGMCRLTPTNVTSAICTAQRITATHVFRFHSPTLVLDFFYVTSIHSCPWKSGPLSEWKQFCFILIEEECDRCARWGNAFTSCPRAIPTLPADDFNRSS